MGVSVLLLWGCWGLPAAGQVPPDSVDAAKLQESIEAVLGNISSVSWKTRPLSAEDKSALRPQLKGRSPLPDSVYVGHTETTEGERFLIPDVTPSKSKTFSLVLYLNESGSVVDVDVLTYRENYGYEVDYELFRRQFRGADDPEAVQFRGTIQNISGATISARSMTHAVNDLLVIVDHVGLDAFRPNP